MNVDDRGVLLGMIFGDGNLQPSKRCMTAQLTIKHCKRQSSYAEYKADLLGKILGGKRPVVFPFMNNGFPAVAMSKTNRYFRVLRNWLYRDGKKTLSPYVNWLTPHGLAIWYMDDGGLGIKRRRGKINAIDLYINCHTNLDEAKAISTAIKSKFDISFLPNLNNRSYRLRCGTREARRFVEIVKPFIVDGMRYKIDPLSAHERPTRKG